MVRAVPGIRRDPLAFLESVTARYGDLVAFPMPRTPTLLLNDPGGVHRVLVENARGYSKATAQYASLSTVTGSGLLTADGEPWRRRRRIVQPAFHRGAIDAVAAHAVGATQQVLGQWQRLADGAVVDVDAAALQATLDVVARSLFGSRLADRGQQVVRAVDEALRSVISRVRTPQPRWLPTPANRRLSRAVDTLDRLCADVVHERRVQGSSGDDVLALLLASADADGGLTDREVRDEIVTLVIAGHETVASALTWTLLLLAQNPQEQEQLHTELDVVLTGRRPEVSDLAALPVTRSVLDESLRLFPPAWVLSRRAVADDEVCGVDVPAGTLVIVSPWLLHRDGRRWRAADRFEPSRFRDEEAARDLATPSSSYLPFGVGPRLCIGRDFARLELVMMLASLLQGHRVSPVPGYRPQVDALVTLRPRGGLPLVVRRR
jgi:cytochrome P450